MNVDTLLTRLEHVHPSGPNSWRSDCPCGHKRPGGELAVTATDDGTLLLHAFCGHSALEVVQAVTLELKDLFPEKVHDASLEGRRAARAAFRQSAWAAALRTIAREATCLEVGLGMLAHDEPLTGADRARLTQACERIHVARDVLK